MLHYQIQSVYWQMILDIFFCTMLQQYLQKPIWMNVLFNQLMNISLFLEIFWLIQISLLLIYMIIEILLNLGTFYNSSLLLPPTAYCLLLPPTPLAQSLPLDWFYICIETIFLLICVIPSLACTNLINISYLYKKWNELCCLFP